MSILKEIRDSRRTIGKQRQEKAYKRIKNAFLNDDYLLMNRSGTSMISVDNVLIGFLINQGSQQIFSLVEQFKELFNEKVHILANCFHNKIDLDSMYLNKKKAKKNKDTKKLKNSLIEEYNQYYQFKKLESNFKVYHNNKRKNFKNIDLFELPSIEKDFNIYNEQSIVRGDNLLEFKNGIYITDSKFTSNKSNKSTIDPNVKALIKEGILKKYMSNISGPYDEIENLFDTHQPLTKTSDVIGNMTAQSFKNLVGHLEYGTGHDFSNEITMLGKSLIYVCEGKFRVKHIDLSKVSGNIRVEYRMQGYLYINFFMGDKLLYAVSCRSLDSKSPLSPNKAYIHSTIYKEEKFDNREDACKAVIKYAQSKNI